MKIQNNTMADRSFSSVELLPVSKHAAAPPSTLPRRTFLRRLGMGAAFLAPGAGLISTASIARAGAGTLTSGDVAILQFLAAAELIEADLWQQYTELGGEDSAKTGYRAALEILDEDQP